jgi:uncharacterized protein (TIGR02145 family)
MKNFISIILILVSALAICQEKKLAIVMGNSNYINGGALKNPVNDAILMSETLTKLGFDVISITNSTKDDMDKAILNYWRLLAGYDVALFYYAGHGVQVEGTNYLIPVDAELEDALALDFEAIDVGRVVKQFERFPNSINIIILDACRDNPFRTWTRGGSKGFTAMPAPSGSIIAFATSAGATASDGSGVNGLYTEKLTQQMIIPQRIEDVFINTRVVVHHESKGQQIPQEWSQLTGTYSFVEGYSPPDSVYNTYANQSYPAVIIPTTAARTKEGPTLGTPVSLVGFGTIELNCFISGDLYIDDELIGVVKPNTAIPIDNIPEGPHELKISGDITWIHKIMVLGDQKTKVSATVYNSEVLYDSRDGRQYDIVQIGNQFWMKSNLAFSTSIGSYSIDNDSLNDQIYGRLYLWETAMEVCPKGWHLPSDEEWMVLEQCIGIDETRLNKYNFRGDSAGDKLKDFDQALWSSQENKSTLYIGSVGFDAVPAGYLKRNKTSAQTDDFAYFWSSTEVSKTHAVYRSLYDLRNSVLRNFTSKVFGYSVRCVKDE